MSCQSTTFRIPRRSALSVSLATGIGVSLCLPAGAITPADLAEGKHVLGAVSLMAGNALRGPKAGQHSQPNGRGPHPTPQTHTVDTCADDDSPGSLRAIIASPNTGDGDTIYLTQLPMGCSTITLDSSTHTPEGIKISQPNLHILGTSGVTIDAGFQSSIFRHIGYGILDIESVTISNGKYVSANRPFGGCIYSKGSVTLKNSRVEDCVVTGTGATAAAGGDVYAAHDVNLDSSTITHGSANGDGAGSRAYGGGLFVGGNFQSTYSTISYNTVSGNNAPGYGGAAVISGSMVTISSSTISSNLAYTDGGLFLKNSAGNAEITNSTISGNKASFIVGGIDARGSMRLANSTVALNHDENASCAGIFVSGSSLVLDSSIVSGNGNALGPADLCADMATSVSGSHNLIVAAVGIPTLPYTISDCPQLQPLANNGGPTLTHAMNPTSPAIDAGSSPPSLLFDQTGYARVEGIVADIGAFEWRTGTSTDRVFVGGFDGLCDQ